MTHDEFVELPTTNDKAAQDRAYWYRQGKDDGAEQERGNIVEWLRHRLNDWPDYVARSDIAEAIERGDHLT